MTAWDPQNPPLFLPRGYNKELPGAGGYPFQGLWEPNGEGNPLLWKLIELLTGETERPQPKASRKNIVDRRGGRFPIERQKVGAKRSQAQASKKGSGLSPLDVLIRWIQTSERDRP